MRLALLVPLCLGLAGCKAEPPAADPLALLGANSEWRVSEIAGAPVAPGVTVTLATPEPGLIAGSSGCNRYSGRVSLRDGQLHVGALAGTRMMCPPAQMQAEQGFHSTIGRVRSARLVAETLELTDEAGTVLIRAAR